MSLVIARTTARAGNRGTLPPMVNHVGRFDDGRLFCVVRVRTLVYTTPSVGLSATGRGRAAGGGYQIRIFVLAFSLLKRLRFFNDDILNMKMHFFFFTLKSL